MLEGVTGAGAGETAAIADIAKEKAMVRQAEMREKFMATLANGKAGAAQPEHGAMRQQGGNFRRNARHLRI